ncbi:hypothetical protein BKA70DRAFT_1333549 [Coprinopsis sp. MPI-PUGE-AT-0042]|nr:hypothetical protein BKA70DRAFT_1333549 [Coprinopsis sp. MPI-PUGE-AT-0042]
MNSNEIQPGEYIIVNSVSKAVLDADDGLVIGNPYTMATSQTRTLATDGNLWTIRNSKSKRYLGMRLTDQMKPGNYVVMREVDQAFSWALQSGADGTIKATVPYSRYLLSLWSGDGKPGTTVHVYDSDDHTLRKWIFAKPQTLPLEDGKIYSLVNASSGTAVGFDTDQWACGFQQKEDSSSKHFRAHNTAHGWAFQHVDTDMYIGLPPTTFKFETGIRVRGVDTPFPWMVVPAAILENENLFKLFVPYTNELSNLCGGEKDDGTKIVVWFNNEKIFKKWEFHSEQPHSGSAKRQIGSILGDPLQST